MNLSRFPNPSYWPAAYGWMLYAVQQLEKSQKPATEDSLLALLHQSGDSQAMAIEAAVARIVINNLVTNGVLHTSTIAEQTAFLCSRAAPTLERHEIGRNHGQTAKAGAPESTPNSSRTSDSPRTNKPVRKPRRKPDQPSGEATLEESPGTAASKTSVALLERPATVPEPRFEAPASKRSSKDKKQRPEGVRARDLVLAVLKQTAPADWFNGDELPLPDGLTRGQLKGALSNLSKGKMPALKRTTRPAGPSNVEYIYRVI